MAKTGEPIRIAVLGETGAGKTALVVKLIAGRFIWNYDPTLEGVYKHHLGESDDDSFSVEIMDTAGTNGSEEDEIVKREGHIKWADAFVLVYSITDRISYTAIKNMRDQIVELKKHHTCCTIVANKSDLHHTRQISKGEGEKTAADLGCSFYELSACTSGTEVTLPFINVCHAVRRAAKQVRRRSSASQLFRKLIQKKLSI